MAQPVATATILNFSGFQFSVFNFSFPVYGIWFLSAFRIHSHARISVIVRIRHEGRHEGRPAFHDCGSVEAVGFAAHGEGRHSDGPRALPADGHLERIAPEETDIAAQFFKSETLLVHPGQCGNPVRHAHVAG